MPLSANPGKALEVLIEGRTWFRVPIKTRLILPGDDYFLIIKQAIADAGIILKKDDILFAGEKAIAIAEGRAWHLNEIKSGWLAKRMSRFVTRNPGGIGISIPETFQLAINEAGIARILLAALLSVMTKPFGVKGVFYHIAGRGVAAIDGPVDYAIPPYNKYCSLGPKDPQAAAKKLAGVLGVRVAVVDANDLGIEVMAVSDASIDPVFIKKALRDNPLGQTDESTPVGILRFTSRAQQSFVAPQ